MNNIYWHHHYYILQYHNVSLLQASIDWEFIATSHPISSSKSDRSIGKANQTIIIIENDNTKKIHTCTRFHDRTGIYNGCAHSSSSVVLGSDLFFFSQSRTYIQTIKMMMIIYQEIKQNGEHLINLYGT